MNIFSKNILLFLIITIFSCIGCEPSMIIGPIVTGVTYWIQGESSRYFEENKEIIYRATKKVISENLTIIKEYEKNNKYYLVAEKRNTFSIRIETIENLTKLSIRINNFGDKPYTEYLYKKITDQISIIEFDSQGKPSKNVKWKRKYNKRKKKSRSY